MTAKSYRLDYATAAAPDTPVAVYDLTLATACRMARKLSAKHEAAYVITSEDDQDVSQRCYYAGRYSHTETD
jgi:hypothetical protein